VLTIAADAGMSHLRVTTIYYSEMVLLHGFVKKSRDTPPADLEIEKKAVEGK
jgi:phage-related protein